MNSQPHHPDEAFLNAKAVKRPVYDIDFASNANPNDGHD
jgi:hypothetical protein